MSDYHVHTVDLNETLSVQDMTSWIFPPREKLQDKEFAYLVRWAMIMTATYMYYRPLMPKENFRMIRCRDRAYPIVISSSKEGAVLRRIFNQHADDVKNQLTNALHVFMVVKNDDVRNFIEKLTFEFCFEDTSFSVTLHNNQHYKIPLLNYDEESFCRILDRVRLTAQFLRPLPPDTIYWVGAHRTPLWNRNLVSHPYSTGEVPSRELIGHPNCINIGAVVLKKKGGMLVTFTSSLMEGTAEELEAELEVYPYEELAIDDNNNRDDILSDRNCTDEASENNDHVRDSLEGVEEARRDSHLPSSRESSPQLIEVIESPPSAKKQKLNTNVSSGPTAESSSSNQSLSKIVPDKAELDKKPGNSSVKSTSFSNSNADDDNSDDDRRPGAVAANKLQSVEVKATKSRKRRQLSQQPTECSSSVKSSRSLSRKDSSSRYQKSVTKSSSSTASHQAQAIQNVPHQDVTPVHKPISKLPRTPVKKTPQEQYTPKKNAKKINPTTREEQVLDNHDTTVNVDVSSVNVTPADLVCTVSDKRMPYIPPESQTYDVFVASVLFDDKECVDYVNDCLKHISREEYKISNLFPHSSLLH